MGDPFGVCMAAVCFIFVCFPPAIIDAFDEVQHKKGRRHPGFKAGEAR